MATPLPKEPKPPEPPANDLDEFLIEADEAEAARFQAELERDARGKPDDW
jgi:hypothetical protein